MTEIDTSPERVRSEIKKIRNFALYPRLGATDRNTIAQRLEALLAKCEELTVENSWLKGIEATQVATRDEAIRQRDQSDAYVHFSLGGENRISAAQAEQYLSEAIARVRAKEGKP